MRALLLASVVAFGWAATAQASVIYNLTLTDAANPTYSGTGSVTLNQAPASTGLTTYQPGEFTNLSFVVDNQLLAAPPGVASVVQFLDGEIYDVTFSEQTGTSPNRFSLKTTGNYVFYYNNLGSAAVGSITSSLAPTAVPEPASLALLGLPLGLLGLVTMRRRRHSAAA